MFEEWGVVENMLSKKGGVVDEGLIDLKKLGDF